jgi:hypothetical protein
MNSQSSSHAKPWYAPFWFMLGVALLALVEQAIVYISLLRGPMTVSGNLTFRLFLWPSILFIEVIVYWLIRKRVLERRLVWPHLVLSLFTFVLIQILFVVVSIIMTDDNGGNHISTLKWLQTGQFYCFWAGVITGHTFFIVAIVRSYSAKHPQLPGDDNDLLSEIAV